jgi:phosphatidylethanolamine/phosphatidyl-N-methylethanolamine N-methyltransferase
MELEAVRRSYRRWAPVYDRSFGAISHLARRHTVAHVNARGGRALEVGIGTGLSLAAYAGGVEVTGIDYSDEMLTKARQKVAEEGLTHVRSLRRMDARSLDFADASFDTAVAMFLVSVAPDPDRVIREMARVTRPGGEVVIVNHFARDSGPLAWAERAFSQFENTLGWHSDFRMERILGVPELDLVEITPLTPLGLFTFLRFQRR